MIITARATAAILCTALGLAASGGARSGGAQEVVRRVTQDSVRRDSVTRSCDTTITRTTAGNLSGARIRSLDIQTNGPKALPGVGRFASHLASHLHATTHSGTVRRDLQFAVHDTVDTTAVGESMRRLRHRSYIRDVVLRGVRCGTDSVDLQVTTYDRWSLSASVGVQSNASYGGLDERNLLGTGREGSVSIASRQGKIGGAVGYTDPFLLNLPVYLKMRAARFVDGSDIRGRVRNADQSVTDRWRSQLVFARYRQDSRKIEQFGGDPVLVEQAFKRDAAFLLFGRRIGEATHTATSILFGADFERASLNAPDNALVVGPRLVERRYHGPTVGLGRQAVAFDTVGWLAERQLLVDIPLGLEMEGLIGAGREDVSRRGAAFGSAWLGKMWIPSRERLVSIDLWTSGYLIGSHHNFDAASSRGLFSYYARSGNTLYSLHGAAEKLVNPDPDVRALETFDPTISLIPTPYRLSENAFAVQLEQARHLRSVIRSIGLDGAVFVATSIRTASALSQHDHFGVTALGAGLRVVPGGAGSGSLRLDILYPVLKSPGTRNGPVLAVSVTPWLQSNRQREDPRLR